MSYTSSYVTLVQLRLRCYVIYTFYDDAWTYVCIYSEKFQGSRTFYRFIEPLNSGRHKKRLFLSKPASIV